jgi:hypothetical protein
VKARFIALGLSQIALSASAQEPSPSLAALAAEGYQVKAMSTIGPTLFFLQKDKEPKAYFCAAKTALGRSGTAKSRAAPPASWSATIDAGQRQPTIQPSTIRFSRMRKIASSEAKTRAALATSSERLSRGSGGRRRLLRGSARPPLPVRARLSSGLNGSSRLILATHGIRRRLAAIVSSPFRLAMLPRYAHCQGRVFSLRCLHRCD